MILSHYNFKKHSAMLWSLLLVHKRDGYFVQLLTLALLLTTSQSVEAQAKRTVDGCTRCPEEQYFNLETGRCEQCTKCLGSLEEKLECANEIPDYCDVLGQFDRLCCEEYEYEAYGECILDCRFCKGSGRCKKGLTECDCPQDRYGVLCQYIVLPSDNVEVDPSVQVTATPTLPVAMTTGRYLVSPTPTIIKGADSE